MNAQADRVVASFLAENQAIVCKIARSFCRDQVDYDDLFQEICIALWTVHDRIPRDVSARTYVYRVALNCAISWHRKRHTYLKHLKGYWREHLANESAHGTEVSHDQTRRLYRAIRSLGESDRSLVLMHLDELTTDEIADVLGINAAAVRKRLSRAKKKLASLLQPDEDRP